MATNADILLELVAIKEQMKRLVSDAESEKDTRKRRNDSLDRENKELRNEISKLKEWKSNLQGRFAMAAIIWVFIQAVIIWFLSNKK